MHTAKLAEGWTKDFALLSKSDVDDSTPAGIAKILKNSITPDLDTELLVRLVSRADSKKGEIYWVKPSELKQLGIAVR